MSLQNISSDLKDDFNECNFLRDDILKINQHKQSSAENSRVILKKFEILHEYLTEFVKSKSSSVGKNQLDQHLSTVQKLKRENDELQSKIVSVQSSCERLIEECNKLPHQLADKKDEAFGLAKSLKELHIEEADLHGELKQAHKLIRNRLEATKIAKKVYKDFLGCHIGILHANDQYIEVLVSLNSSHRASGDSTDSLKLRQDLHKRTWTLIETNPLLFNLKLWSEKLEESQDTQGLLEYLQSISKEVGLARHKKSERSSCVPQSVVNGEYRT